jgi:hypothetical protein
MRPSLILGISALLAMLSLGAPANADGNNFDVAAAKGQVTVTPHSGWHINLEYSWALKKGDDKIKTKTDFKLATDAASVSGVAAGAYTLKGAVCSKENCAPFTTQVTVQ